MNVDWLSHYLEYTKHHESPQEFHFWIGLSILGGILRRNVWIDRGSYKVYPNQYTILVAESGGARKSAAMNIGMNIFHKVSDRVEGNISVLHERSSLEGLMDLMNRTRILPNGSITRDGSVFIMADELTNFFGKSSYITDLMAFLTAAYTSQPRLEFHTRTKGTCSIRNPCPCILSGTTPEQFAEAFPSATLSSGLLARMIIVRGRGEKREPKPLLKQELEEFLIQYLVDLTSVYGEIKLSKEAEKQYDQWYKSLSFTPPDDVLLSFWERIHDHVLKTALLISISNSKDMVITSKQFFQGLSLIDKVKTNLSSAMKYIGATTESILGDQIISGLISAGGELSHSNLMRKIYRRVRSVDEFNSIITTLVQLKRVEILRVKGTGMFYRLLK